MIPQPACTGPVAWRDREAIRRDIADLVGGGPATAYLFMTAASPGVIAHFLPNAYYPSHEAYIRPRRRDEAEYQGDRRTPGSCSRSTGPTWP